MSDAHENSKLRSRFSLAAVEGRHKMGLTQEEAAERLSIATRSLQLIEGSNRLPKLPVALRMAKLYKLDLSLFLDCVDLDPGAPQNLKNLGG